MLHIVKHPQQLVLIGRYLQANDQLLLVESAVYATSEHSPYFAHLPTQQCVYALKEDLEARGWINRCAQNIQVVNVDAWVELSVNHDKSMSW
ncbi:sulfurtransferase complex subunit TusB [Vibrio sp. Vf1514]|uniref:sulfurtransferase complex subunit TusB n=1 Tax=Vibrio sp. Vf1514 TaxID=3437381 RepID=UPI003F8B4D1F